MPLPVSTTPKTKDGFERVRNKMIETQLKARGIKNKKVLAAFGNIPRQLFLPEALRSQAYSDYPLPIGGGQTISQPYIVAYMTELLNLKPTDKVLEVGTGSGYQAAVLSQIVDKVFTIERVHKLATATRKLLQSLGYNNIIEKIGDGTLGWKEFAPYDAIIVTAGGHSVPENYIDQLAVGGRLVIPFGTEDAQELYRFTKTPKGVRKENLGNVKFVKLVGRKGWGGESE